MKCIYSIDAQDNLISLDVEDDAEIPAGWESTPAAFGIETCPGAEPDPALLTIRVFREKPVPLRGNRA